MTDTLHIIKPKGRKEIDRIEIKKGRRGDFSPLQSDHYHNFYEIFYLLSGHSDFLLKDSIYHMEKGDLVFIAPSELHHSLYNADCEVCMIYFRPEHRLIQSFPLPHSFKGSVPALYQDPFHTLLNRMIAEYANADEYSNAFMAAYLQEILLMLMRHSVMAAKEPELLNAKDADILRAMKHIYNHYTSPLTLEEVSSIASLSPTYFSKKFKQITGMGFKEYVNFVRLKHARQALLTTKSSITEIALAYGFNDSNYFKDLFKKVYGKSPREFRKNPD